MAIRIGLTRSVKFSALYALAAFFSFGTLLALPGMRIEVSYPESLESGPVDGRLLLTISERRDGEPRFQVGNWRRPEPIFGIDVEGLKPGETRIFDESVLGYPVESLKDLPPGDYNLQAVLNIYTTFIRSDGHTVKLPMDHWEGQKWEQSPGNLVSEPLWARLDPQEGFELRLPLARRLPQVDFPEDTKYVKHIKLRSQLLSDFWGTDMHIGAVVLLPEGFDEHPDARYPIAYWQGHFRATFDGLRESPPDNGVSGLSRRRQQRAYDFYRTWSSDDFPRMIVVIPQDPNPYYDDSYAVNSANLGPYGDALHQELIPYIEGKFRAIAEPWARTLYGGSTGGWRALALQVFHPSFYNGSWAFCPDPVDFRYFQLINIYQDENAYFPRSGLKKNPIRPWMRLTDDQVLVTVKEASIRELVLGTRGRSGDQMDVFQAVFGPAGDDGYPQLLYDKVTGKIDPEVAEYWRENYDLSHILRRDWAELGPQLEGKLRVFMGTADTFYLDEATRLLEDFLESTDGPYYGGSVEWGEGAPHCWTGAPSGQDATLYYIPRMAEHIRSTAPEGADLTSWDY